MPLITELVMPKLGLTMTEGRIAAWSVQPGARFTGGALVVVVETDKIATDIEAPGPGRLVEVLASEGDVIPVGAPIARWELDDASGAAPTPSGDPASERLGGMTRSGGPAETEARPGRPSPLRLIATPYARRLAREGGLQLEAIAGSGPGGRIRGCDVVGKLSAISDACVASPSPLIPAEQTAPVPRAEIRPASLSLMIISRECSEIAKVLGRLAGETGEFKIDHIIALAAVRALGDLRHGAVKLGIEDDGGNIVCCAIPQHCRLGALARLMERPEPADEGPGDVAIVVAPRGISMFCPALPEAWPIVLGVAITTRDGCIEATIAMAYDDRRIAHRDAGHLLTAIGQFLDDPLVLLVS